MKTYNITKFKAHALKLIADVSRTHEEIIITKRGKPLAKLIPNFSKTNKPVPGKLSNTLIIQKDIIAPLGNKIWQSAK